MYLPFYYPAIPFSRARYPLAFFPFHSRGPSTFSYFLHGAGLRNRQPHRNRQRSCTLPELLVPRPAPRPPAVIQSALRTFRSSRVTSLRLSLSSVHSTQNRSSRTVSPCFSRSLASPAHQHPPSFSCPVREIDSSHFFLLLRCTRLLAPSISSPHSILLPFSVNRTSRLALPFLSLFALSTFFHLLQYLFSVAVERRPHPSRYLFAYLNSPANFFS